MSNQLSQLAVTLLCGRPPDVAQGATEAVRCRLAGLFLDGLSGQARALAGPARDALRRAAQREAADYALIAREQVAVLEALAPLVPVVLKGRALAELWPHPSLRPPGDLDLLLPERALLGAVTTLCELGYRPLPVEAPGRLRAPGKGVELQPPHGRHLAVDLHARLFRSVGARIDAQRLLARARPVRFDGQPVRMLDEADRLLFVFVHAAKHGVRELKWLLDLYAVALHSGEPIWSAAVARARAAGATRPFFVAARLAATLPGAQLPALDELRPALVPRVLIDRLIRVDLALRGAALARWECYALELLLEERLLPRARRLAGVFERLVRRG